MLAIEVDDAGFVIDVVAADLKDVPATDAVAVEVVNIIDDDVVLYPVVSVKIQDEELRSSGTDLGTWVKA